MNCISLNEKYKQTSRGNFLCLAASIIVGIAFCILAGRGETQPQQTDTPSGSEVTEAKQPISYKPFTWRSAPPDDCPFERSTDIVGIRFTGKCNDLHMDGAPFADTWYFSWASDDKLYSPFTDGAVPRLDGGRDHSISWKYPYSTGQAIAEGDDPINFKIYSLGLTHSPPEPYGGRYPCGSLVYNGVWYYGTYCLSPEGFTFFGGERYNWPWLGPFVGFRISTDFGRTWKNCPHTPGKPLFNETGMYGYPVKIGAPHFVDFGKKHGTFS